MSRSDLIDLLSRIHGKSRKECELILSYLPDVNGFDRSGLVDDPGRVFWYRLLEEVNKVMVSDAD